MYFRNFRLLAKFIKDTIYNAKNNYFYNGKFYPKFLEWVPFDRFEDINQIGEGGFAKVYSATWIDGKTKYKRHDGSLEKREPEPIKVALKKLNESQNISPEYLNEIKILWNFYLNETSDTYLKFYGITKDDKTKKFMMIMQLVNQGNLRSVLSSNFNNIVWIEKLLVLHNILYDLKDLHKLGYFHKDLNILLNRKEEPDKNLSYVSDFGLSGPSNEHKSDNKTCGVLPYISPEVLNGEPYSLIIIF
ncbi:Mkk2p [Rhizophagus irregularis DAOM 197198w]|uniref:non-specific serine/threonine protein kinase n=1 Tax=Rhizophagus irregularis (strain DAOM 197198w) TaxID=1432141 RepID=A0A015JZ31_RHIIW|nr:Mkk2p [Rhizophagus irregularis DAOM 197198w]